MGEVGHLSKLHEKYYDLGFRVVAVSAESSTELRKKMLEERGVAYWIGSDPNSSTLRAYAHDDRIGIPHSYLIDAEGIVRASGHASEEQIEELLSAPPKHDLGRPLHDKLRVAEELFACGGYGAAWKAAARLLDDDPAVAEDAKLVRQKAEEAADRMQRTAAWHLERSPIGTAYGELLVLRIACEGLEPATWAKEHLEKLRKNDAIQSDTTAWRRLEDALKVELRARGRARERERARTLYERVLTQHRSTPAAKLARTRLSRL